MSPTTPSPMTSSTPGPLRRLLRRDTAVTNTPSPSRIHFNTVVYAGPVLAIACAGAASFRGDRGLPGVFVAARVASDVSWGVRSE